MKVVYVLLLVQLIKTITISEKSKSFIFKNGFYM